MRPRIAGVMRCAASRPKRLSPPGKKSCKARSGWLKWRSRRLAEKQVIQLDEERKAAMVSNLLGVVLCSESEVHPVVNTGTLYT